MLAQENYKEEEKMKKENYIKTNNSIFCYMG